MGIIQLLDRPIAFHRSFVKLGIGINGALMLSQAVYWAGRTSDPEGWFYKTMDEWKEETGLTRREQDTARRALRLKSLMAEEKRGAPCKIFFRVNELELENALKSSLNVMYNLGCTDQPTQVGGIRQPVVAEPANLEWRNAPTSYTETTYRDYTETTTGEVETRSRANPRPKSPDLDFSSWPGMPTDQTMKDWKAMRKAKKYPVSQTVITRLAPKLQAAADLGYSVDDCLAECVLRGWQGFEVQWIENAKGSTNGGRGGYRSKSEQIAEFNRRSGEEFLRMGD